jgi:hypothetical protein
MLRHALFYMKGGFQTFAASARWECVNSESRHSHCRGTQFLFAPPQGGLELISLIFCIAAKVGFAEQATV